LAASIKATSRYASTGRAICCQSGPSAISSALHDPAAQHAVPGVALEREHGGGAAGDGDRRIVLHGERGHEPVEESGLIREGQREASTIHPPPP
jgi:hypothetical protein